MADDRRQPPDSTAPMSRDDLGGTAAMPRHDDNDAEATRIRPAGAGGWPSTEPANRPTSGPASGPASGPLDGTRMMPPAGPGGPGVGGPGVGGAEPRWAGSASVPPPPGPGQVRGYYDEFPPEPAPVAEDRSWLRPVLFGVIGLVLLVALLTGVWLIFTADDEPPPTTEASAPPAASAVQTTEAPPTKPATSEPATSAGPQVVQVPDDLVGLSEADARKKLTDAGLRVQVTRRADSTMAPGTVLETVPGAGANVEANSVVRIVVATAPPNPKPSASASYGNG
jgi:hypothetical protein